VIKVGGELLEAPAGVARLAREIVCAAETSRVVVVHGGGRTIDAELARRGIARVAVDGVRVTDHTTLDVVVSVLGGLMNTRLVAAIGAGGGRAVGLTGADAAIGLCEQAPPHRAASGAVVDLGLVGRPLPDAPPALLVDLCEKGYIPVVASIGAAEDGRLLNVNADTWAAHLASVLCARQLLIVGATAGVLDGAGSTLAMVDVDLIDDLVADGRVSAGMIAKLDACRRAWQGGVRDIRIVDGRGPGGFEFAPGTRVVGDGWRALDAAQAGVPS
jgi:acetylglutamate kinase